MVHDEAFVRSSLEGSTMKRLQKIFRNWRGSIRANEEAETVRSFNDYANYLRRRIERGEAVIR